MAEIRTRNTPEWIVTELDRIVSEEGYENRQDLINHILELYCSAKSKVLTAALPDIVRALCTQSIAEQNVNLENCIKAMGVTQKHIADTLDELRAVLFSEDNRV